MAKKVRSFEVSSVPASFAIASILASDIVGGGSVFDGVPESLAESGVGVGVPIALAAHNKS